MISKDDCLWFIDQALDGMVQIVMDLGDDLANQRPDIANTNTPYAILAHCVGVIEYWGGDVIAGRDVERDREGEFRSHGPTARLIDRARRARQQLEQDLADLDGAAPPRRPPTKSEHRSLPFGRTQGGALSQIETELAQHRGQMELTRDVLRAPWVRLASDPAPHRR